MHDEICSLLSPSQAYIYTAIAYYILLYSDLREKEIHIRNDVYQPVPLAVGIVTDPQVTDKDYISYYY
jgi:hypothetical protein